SLPAEERQRSQQEVNKFVRWCGADRPISSLTAREVESYAEGLGPSATNPQELLKPSKAFLTHAKKQGLISTNLAVQLKAKKTTSEGKFTPERPRDVIHLTPEGYAELEKKVEVLRKERPHIAEELRHARADKDFRENAPLDAAREHQAQVEAQIRQLEATLKAAVVMENQATSKRNSKIDLGSTVLLRDLTYDEEVRYTLVSPSEASPLKGKISSASPLGKALLNRSVGEVVEISAPDGVMRYRVEKTEE
ncbi:MAG: transcription elongation factor GreA, partial [Chloroflexota bacterium]